MRLIPAPLGKPEAVQDRLQIGSVVEYLRVFAEALRASEDSVSGPWESNCRSCAFTSMDNPLLVRRC
jgi:hypothetical protein